MRPTSALLLIGSSEAISIWGGLLRLKLENSSLMKLSHFSASKQDCIDFNFNYFKHQFSGSVIFQFSNQISLNHLQDKGS